MKRGFLFGFIAASAMAMGQESAEETEHEEAHHCYFHERSVSLGLALPYSFHLETIGINSRVYYNLGENLCVGPEFAYFSQGDHKTYDFNIVGHYIIETPIVGIFPALGLNYTMEQDARHQSNALGMIYGAGIHRNFGMVTTFAEYVRTISQLEDSFVNVGLMYTFK